MPTPGVNVTPVSGDVRSVFGQSISCLGPIVIPVNIDMRGDTTGLIDFSSVIQQDVIDFISGVYVDNLNGPEKISFVANGTLMRYTVGANTQAFFQMMPVNPAQILWSTPGINGIIVPCYFGNIPWVPFNNKP